MDIAWSRSNESVTLSAHTVSTARRVIADDCDPYWHWRKSQWMHEQGTESQGKKHKVIMYALE